MNRREFLTATSALGAALFRHPQPAPAGRLLSILPLGRLEENAAPLERLLGTGLDARKFTDLSTLNPETLLTDSERFFIRTARPAAAERATAWSVRLSGFPDESASLSLEALRDLARPMGAHLLECSGNSDPENYGLMSAADWEGVPLPLVLERERALPKGTRVGVSGIDETALFSRTSEPGAAWIFSRDDLQSSGAFLATAMNGRPLGPHHGFPLRLVVPGWYACCSIKWVDRIELVPDDAPATPHMREFASRTDQAGARARARVRARGNRSRRVSGAGREVARLWPPHLSRRRHPLGAGPGRRTIYSSVSEATSRSFPSTTARSRGPPPPGPSGLTRGGQRSRASIRSFFDSAIARFARDVSTAFTTLATSISTKFRVPASKILDVFVAFTPVKPAELQAGNAAPSNFMVDSIRTTRVYACLSSRPAANVDSHP